MHAQEPHKPDKARGRELQGSASRTWFLMNPASWAKAALLAGGLFWVPLSMTAGKGEGAEVPFLLLALLLAALCAILGLAAIGLTFRRGGFRFWFVSALLLAVIDATGFVTIGLENSRRGSSRAPCASNLRLIGQGILLYAIDHGQQLPKTLGELAVLGVLQPEALVCPESGQKPARGSTPGELAGQYATGAHVTYVYLRTANTIDEQWADDLVAYCPPTPEQDGCYAMFGDGHVQWLMSSTELNQRIAETKARAAARAPASTMPSSRPAR